MRKLYVFGVLLAAASAIHAQTINVRGKLTNPSGQAVTGALVELIAQGLKDTTGADGMFVLAKSSISVRNMSGGSGMSLEGGFLQMRVGERAPLSIKVSDIQGNLLWKQAVPNASGFYSWNLAESAGSGNLLIIQASIGGETQTFRYIPVAGRGKATLRMAAGEPTHARLAKASAAVDTLRVTAAGFAEKKVPVASFDTTINLALEAAGDIWGGLKNPPRKSPGCGKAAGVTNGRKLITSGGQSRSYTIDIPTGYDMNKAYRFFYCSHWISSNDETVVGQNYYFLKPLATAANEPAIFLAPQAGAADAGSGTWSTNSAIDNNLFADILTFVKENLCIDETRVFATGFSYGGMMTYSLSENRQTLIRAAVGIGPANYNIYVPPKTKLPIAWMSTTGMSDNTTPWVNNEAQRRGAKFIALDHAINNGCTPPSGNNIPTWTSGAHVCYDFAGCKVGYPVKACTFGGGHDSQPRDPGASTTWIPQESWKFFQQF